MDVNPFGTADELSGKIECLVLEMVASIEYVLATVKTNVEFGGR